MTLVLYLLLRFQSTLPVWGATGIRRADLAAVWISIHAPRVGSDPRITYERDKLGRFQSTLPVWGATRDGDQLRWDTLISIHAPRVGSDGGEVPLYYWCKEISIHAPRVGSDVPYRSMNNGSRVFQSTLPVWGATKIA